MGGESLRQRLLSFGDARVDFFSEADTYFNKLLKIPKPRCFYAEQKRDSRGYAPFAIRPLLVVGEHLGLDSSDVFCDLGGGVGCPSLVFAETFGVTAISIEIVPELYRLGVKTAARLGIEVDYRNSDVLDADFSAANIFHLFNPFCGETLYGVGKMLFEHARKLARMEEPREIIIIASYGAEKEFVNAPWLVPDKAATEASGVPVFRSRIGPGSEDYYQKSESGYQRLVGESRGLWRLGWKNCD